MKYRMRIRALIWPIFMHLKEELFTIAMRLVINLSTPKRKLGEEKFSLMHFHMYPVEIGPYGEKKHKAFDDVYENDGEQIGKFCPRSGDLMASIAKMNMNPVVVCEAYNSQDTGALLMKQDLKKNL